MIIKSPDNKEKRLKLLEDLQLSPMLTDKQRKWLRDEFWRLQPGLKGERDAAHYLNAEFKDAANHAVLHDLRLVEDGQVAQIDHLVIGRALLIYLLETKSYQSEANLHINEYGEFSVEYADGRVFGIESPLEQSRRHEPIVRKALERLGISGRWGLHEYRPEGKR